MVLSVFLAGAKSMKMTGLASVSFLAKFFSFPKEKRFAD